MESITDHVNEYRAFEFAARCAKIKVMQSLVQADSIDTKCGIDVSYPPWTGPASCR